ncbi:MAG: organic solvent tolerance protein OstA [Spirochaetaceae bacterium]|nr:MAG: organic solvent tolerance protein OstA [Spirochaetaceae bacterium]
MRRNPFPPGLWLAALPVLGILFAPPPASADSFRFSGDRTEIVLAEGRERTLLRGNARVISSEITLEAEEIELFGTDFRYAVTRGRVRVTDAARDMTITADTLRFDRETENSRATGNVTVEDRANDLVLKGGYLETREGGDLLFVQIAVRVLQDDLTARAQFLRYRRLEEILELSGFPVVYWKGDQYRATRIILNLDTEEIEMQGQVEGSIFVERGEEDEPEEDEPEEDETPDAGDSP